MKGEARTKIPLKEAEKKEKKTKGPKGDNVEIMGKPPEAKHEGS